MISELISQTKNDDVQNYIFSHENDDERSLVLNNKQILGLPSAWIAQQIAGRRKAKTKLPTWYRTKGIIYPPTLNLEQSSSEATAKFKSKIIDGGTSGVDFTGGFGIDSFYLSQRFKKFISVESDKNLVDIVKHNHASLGADNIFHVNADAETFINTAGRTAFIFVDPSRRNNHQKVFKLADCIPNVAELLPVFFEKSDAVLIKASPLLDLQQGIRELKNVAKIYVVAVDNECKELLFQLNVNVTNPASIEAVDLDLEGNVIQRFSFLNDEEKTAVSTFSAPLDWLYEPGTAILKAGAFKTVGNRNEVFKLHPNSHLYTSKEPLVTFPGRIFKVLEHIKLSKELKNLFPDGYANILARNFPLSVEEIKKKTGLKEGGTLYLICTESESGKNVMIAERIFQK
jgi:hypothetical protein